mmetsp:Transcript_70083/g.182486  ORF Transcript_70083/g.182486 Transcript_70083/m.182486 type:complete len:417 (-) Transcript_70083:393-1643(-)
MPEHKKSVSINEDDVKKVEQPKKKENKDAKFRETWKVPARYEIRQLLGSGAYGCVAEAKDNEKKRKVAIKRAKGLLDDLVDAKRMLREIAILTELDHNHLVRCYDVVVPNDLKRFNEIYIVLEICDSDLKKLIRAEVNLNKLHVTSLLYNLLLGLNYLHSAGIWHRDLKPANCLVNEDCSVKICDFGLSVATCQSLNARDEQLAERRHLTGHVVSRWYRAPELILLQEDYTEAIDVWSVGCIYAELLGMLEGQKNQDRGPLFPGQSCFPLSPHAAHKNDTKYYTKGDRDQLSMIFALLGTPSTDDIEEIQGEHAQCYLKLFGKKPGSGVKAKFGAMDPVGSDLLEQMLVFNPRKRITVAQALDHELFAKVRDRRLETTAKSRVVLDFETEEELDEKQLRSLFLREVRKFHPEVPVV